MWVGLLDKGGLEVRAPNYRRKEMVTNEQDLCWADVEWEVPPWFVAIYWEEADLAPEAVFPIEVFFTQNIPPEGDRS